MSESNRKEINHRLLIATTDRIGANARQVLDAQEKVVRYHLTHFENAAVDYADNIIGPSTSACEFQIRHGRLGQKLPETDASETNN